MVGENCLDGISGPQKMEKWRLENASLGAPVIYCEAKKPTAIKI